MLPAVACAHGDARPVVDCPDCGQRGIARCACFADVRCPAHRGPLPPPRPYRLVSIEAITGAALATMKGYPENVGAFRVKASGIGRVVPGSALVVPPPPDYSTPAAVTARCREAGTRAGDDIRAAGNSIEFRRLYRDFRTVVPALPCRVEDQHVSRVVARRRPDGQWDLVQRTPPPETPSTPRASVAA